MGSRGVAMVTGASRGIGRATAVVLARSGFDLVLTARTQREGDGRVGGSSVGDPIAGVPLAGSLERTAADVVAVAPDCRVTPVAMDLTDRSSVVAAADAALAVAGRVDVLVDNAIYQGPGINDRLLDVPIELVARVVEADALHPLLLVQRLLPAMLDAGNGVVVHLTSGAATLVPRAPAGSGGWGVGYALGKGAAHRWVGVLHAEHAAHGIRAYNVNPGHVVTEAMRVRAEREGREVTGQPPEPVAAAIGWLVDGSPEARELAGSDVVARDVVVRHGLLDR